VNLATSPAHIPKILKSVKLATSPKIPKIQVKMATSPGFHKNKLNEKKLRCKPETKLNQIIPQVQKTFFLHAVTQIINGTF